jgi:NAD(P)H-dependent nitrite reductase small subunit
VLLGDTQIAIFRFEPSGRWFATQNRCPHWGEEILSRGLLAEHGGEPKVVCPFHKRSFSLESGACSSDEVGGLQIYLVRLEGDDVYINLSPSVIAQPGRVAC